GLRVRARTLNCPWACRARTTAPPCCPVAPITAISFLLLDDMSVPFQNGLMFTTGLLRGAAGQFDRFPLRSGVRRRSRQLPSHSRRRSEGWGGRLLPWLKFSLHLHKTIHGPQDRGWRSI